MNAQHKPVSITDPMGIEYVRLASVKGMINLERVGMKSRGGSVKNKVAMEFGLPTTATHAKVVEHVAGKMALLIELRSMPEHMRLTHFNGHKVWPLMFSDPMRAAQGVAKYGVVFYVGMFDNDEWRIIESDEDSQPAIVGRIYKSRSELLADADKYAYSWGI